MVIESPPPLGWIPSAIPTTLREAVIRTAKRIAKNFFIPLSCPPCPILSFPRFGRGEAGVANEVRRQDQKKSRPGLRRASIRETQKQRRVRKINHTPAPPTSTTQTISRRPFLYLPGQNSIIRIASRGQSRCVWRCVLRRQGAGCWSRPAPACTILCLSFYYSECSVKKQPGFFDRTEMNRNFLKKSGGFAFSAKNLRVPCQFGAPGDPE